MQTDTKHIMADVYQICLHMNEYFDTATCLSHCTCSIGSPTLLSSVSYLENFSYSSIYSGCLRTNSMPMAVVLIHLLCSSLSRSSTMYMYSKFDNMVMKLGLTNLFKISKLSCSKHR